MALRVSRPVRAVRLLSLPFSLVSGRAEGSGSTPIQPPWRRVARLPPSAAVRYPPAAISRATYEKAGVRVASAVGAAQGAGGRSVQGRLGGRSRKGGRPGDTRRDAWKTLETGMMRAGCKSVLVVGFEACMRSLFNETFCRDDLCRPLAFIASACWRVLPQGDMVPEAHLRHAVQVH